jgi:hypothetical protein
MTFMVMGIVQVGHAVAAIFGRREAYPFSSRHVQQSTAPATQCPLLAVIPTKRTFRKRPECAVRRTSPSWSVDHKTDGGPPMADTMLHVQSQWLR